MDSFSRRSFVKSIGLGAGVAALPSGAKAQGSGVRARCPPAENCNRSRRTALSPGPPGLSHFPSEFPMWERDLMGLHSLKLLRMQVSIPSTSLPSATTEWPTTPARVVPVHPSLKFDLLGEMIHGMPQGGYPDPGLYHRDVGPKCRSEARRLARFRRTRTS